jgi:hypothetical protein
MKFPITRESLQAFDPVKEREELLEEDIEKHLRQALDIVCKEFKQSMPSNSKEKKYVWRNLHILSSIQFNGIMRISQKDQYLPRFVEKLKETFIGCDIIIDPLKTYLIIDWS